MATSLRKIHIALVAIAIIAQPTFSQNTIGPIMQKLIDDTVKYVYLPSAGINQLGLTIIQNDGRLLYTTGYGMADSEKNVPFQNTTQCNIGSISKSLASVVIIKLLNEKFPEMGEKVLDTPIRKLVPHANFTMIDRFRSESLTFKDLLGHRVCLYLGDAPVFAETVTTTEQIAYNSRYQEEYCSVRSEFHYNNRMYVLAGEMAGILAGKRYEDLAYELLEAIGMNNSVFTKKEDDYSNMPHRAMPQYVRNWAAHPVNPELAKRIRFAAAAGGLFATPNDMARYMRFLLNEGSIGGVQIVPKDVMKWLRKTAIAIDLFQFRENDNDVVATGYGYGLGLFLGAYNGYEFVYHGGSYPPYISSMSLFPAKNLAIFTTTSQSPVKVDQLALHGVIYEALKGNANALELGMKLQRQLEAQKKHEKELAETEFNQYIERVKSTSKVRTAEDIVGKYGSGSLGEVTISEKFNWDKMTAELYFEYGIWYTGWLEPLQDGVVYALNIDTDAKQEDFIAGSMESTKFVVFDGEELNFMTMGAWPEAANIFRKGVDIDQLPPVPWAPDSCSPEDME